MILVAAAITANGLGQDQNTYPFTGVPTAGQDVSQHNAEQILMLISENQTLILLQNGQEIFTKELPHLQFPKISAVYETANMVVINDTAYVGGSNGTIYKLHIFKDGSKVSVNVSTIDLNLSCTAENFVNDGSGVIAACFGNDINILYIVDVHVPTKTREQNTTNIYISNFLPIVNAFYYAESNHLFRADSSGIRVVESWQNCIQPWLILQKYYYIIVHCFEKSFIFVPPELSSGGVPGIRRGEWENNTPYPCHGIGPAPIVFSSNGTAMTFYDINNNFQQTITLNEVPDVTTITCAWSNNDLNLIYRSPRHNSWIKLTLDSNYEYKDSTEILFSQGILDPLPTKKGNINQSTLLFYADDLCYLLIPSENQNLLDLKKDYVYPNITNSVVLYHNMISFKAKGNDTIAEEVTKKSTSITASYIWGIAIIVGIVSLAIVVAGIVFYRVWQHKHRNGITER